MDNRQFSFRALALVFSLLAPAIVAAEATAQVATEAPGITSTVTFLYYKDIEAQVPFYEEVLQLQASMDEDWVKIYPITESMSVGLVLDGRGHHRVSADKPVMLSIVTDEVDAWYERIRQMGVPVLRELPPPAAGPKDGGAPIRGFMVADPGGYTIEFFSWSQSD